MSLVIIDNFFLHFKQLTRKHYTIFVTYAHLARRALCAWGLVSYCRPIVVHTPPAIG